MDNIQQQLDELKHELQVLKTKRIYQLDIANGVVRNRHLGEANTYILAGLEANRPTGHTVTSSTVAFFALDTKKLWCWTGSSWVSTTLA